MAGIKLPFSLEKPSDNEFVTDSNSINYNSKNTVKDSLDTINTEISSSKDSGFFVVDKNNRIGLKYNEEGLDVAKFSEHFIGLANNSGIGSDTNSEKITNKVTKITNQSTDSEYPSAKAVYSALNPLYSDYQSITYHGGAVNFNCDEIHNVYVKIQSYTDYSLQLQDSSTWLGGCDIYNDVLLLAFNKGYFATVNYSDKSMRGFGTFGSYNSTNHCNNISFSNLFYDSSDNLPLVYISDCYENGTTGTKKCYVERLSEGTDSLHITGSGNIILTIIYSGNKLLSAKTCDWVIDRITNYLYAYGYDINSEYSANYTKLVIMKFNIPDISESSITLTDDDIIEFKTTEFSGILQGVSVKEGKFAIPYTYSQNGSVVNSGLLIYDYNKNLILSDISLYNFTTNELEGVSIYDNSVNITAHTPNVNIGDVEYIKIIYK